MLRKALTPTASVLFGAAFAASFSPLGFYWLSIPALSLQLALLSGRSRAYSAFLHQFLFAAVWFSTTLCWVADSIAVHGRLPFVFAVAAVAALAGVCALFSASAAALSTALFKGRAARLFAAAGLIAASEWFRGRGFADFSWAAPAYSVIDLPLAGLAVVGGIHFVNLVVLTCAASLAFIVMPASSARRAAAAAFICISVAAGQYFLSSDASTPWKRVEARMVQADLEIVDAFSRPNQASRILDVKRLVESNPFSDDKAAAKITVAPEGVLVLPFERLSREDVALIGELEAAAKSPIALNGFRTAGLGDYRNSLALISSDAASFVDKRKLVPFGEYVPHGFRWFVDMLGIPMTDLTPGEREQKMLEFDGVKMAVLICYENLDGEILLDMWRSGGRPNFLLVTANLGWFGSAVVDQHLDMTRMRAIELQRPAVSVNNNGSSALVSSRGEVLCSLGLDEAVSKVVSFESRRGGSSPYMSLGEIPAAAFFVLLMFFAAWISKKEPKD